jgi:hypothetical protein
MAVIHISGRVYACLYLKRAGAINPASAAQWCLTVTGGGSLCRCAEFSGASQTRGVERNGPRIYVCRSVKANGALVTGVSRCRVCWVPGFSIISPVDTTAGNDQAVVNRGLVGSITSGVESGAARRALNAGLHVVGRGVEALRTLVGSLRVIAKASTILAGQVAGRSSRFGVQVLAAGLARGIDEFKGPGGNTCATQMT